MRTHSLFVSALLCAALLLPSVAKAELRWFKGNTHTHTLWSDGNDFPEMVVDWYRRHGYHFLALSDHNILSEGEKWMRLIEVDKRRKTVFGKSPLAKYQKRFPADGWVELRGNGDAQEVRLKTLAEIRPLFEKPEEFLLVQAEEISAYFEVMLPANPRKSSLPTPTAETLGDVPPAGSGQSLNPEPETKPIKLPVHLNALGLSELIKPEKGDSVTDTIRKNVRAAQEQADRLGQEILVHLNHPNFGWAVTAEDLAHAIEEEFFEIYNGHPSINHLGDEERPGDEELWDIANTIRLESQEAPALLGLATDDSHTYHGGDVRPGRGWVMVQAEELKADALIRAMKRGDFYASTGVTLQHMKFDPGKRYYRVEIEPDVDETYRIEFIGSLKGDANSVGKVLAAHTGHSADYHFTGKELFVRARVTSSANHQDPSFPSQKKQAWTQPIGWRPAVKSP